MKYAVYPVVPCDLEGHACTFCNAYLFCSWPVGNLASGHSKKNFKLFFSGILCWNRNTCQSREQGMERFAVHNRRRGILEFVLKPEAGEKGNITELDWGRWLTDNQERIVLNCIWWKIITFQVNKKGKFDISPVWGTEAPEQVVHPGAQTPPAPPIFHNLTFHQWKQVHTFPPPPRLPFIRTEAGRVNRILKTLRLSKQKMCSGLGAASVCRDAGAVLHGSRDEPDWEPMITMKSWEPQELFIFWHEWKKKLEKITKKLYIISCNF